MSRKLKKMTMLFGILAFVPFVLAACGQGSSQDTTATSTTVVVPTHRITLEVNGGNALSDLIVKENDGVILPTPTKENCKFEGWYTDEALTNLYSNKKMGTSDFTLYAKWTEITYTVSFITYSQTKIESKTYKPGEYINLPKPTMDNYEFIAWYQYEKVLNPMLNNLSAYYEAFSNNTYCLTTDTAINSSKTYYRKMKVSTYVMQKHDVVLYAEWNFSVRTISFVTNGGDPLDSVSYLPGAGIKLPDATRDKYKFLGWYTDSLLSNKFAETTMPSTNITLYAKWEKVAYDLTLNYNDNEDPEKCTIKTKQYYPDMTVELDTPVYAEHSFQGWYKDESFNEKVNGSSYVTGSANTTLYAKWAVKTYSVSFETGMDDLKYESLELKANDVITLPNVSKAGYSFQGWYYDNTYTEAVEANPIVESKDYVLYAKISKQYSVEFDGVNEIAKTGVAGDVIDNLPNPSKEHYSFNGWFLDPDEHFEIVDEPKAGEFGSYYEVVSGEYVKTTDSSSVQGKTYYKSLAITSVKIVDKDITLYPYFVQEEYTITLNFNHEFDYYKKVTNPTAENLGSYYELEDYNISKPTLHLDGNNVYILINETKTYFSSNDLYLKNDQGKYISLEEAKDKDYVIKAEDLDKIYVGQEMVYAPLQKNDVMTAYNNICDKNGNEFTLQFDILKTYYIKDETSSSGYLVYNGSNFLYGYKYYEKTSTIGQSYVLVLDAEDVEYYSQQKSFYYKTTDTELDSSKTYYTLEHCTGTLKYTYSKNQVIDYVDRAGLFIEGERDIQSNELIGVVYCAAHTFGDSTVKQCSDYYLRNCLSVDGYTFAGWYLDDAYSATFNTAYRQDLNLYANWNSIGSEAANFIHYDPQSNAMVVISLYGNDGENVLEDKYLYPERDGFVLAGYYQFGSYKTDANGYVTSIDYSGNTLLDASDIKYKFGETIQIAEYWLQSAIDNLEYEKDSNGNLVFRNENGDLWTEGEKFVTITGYRKGLQNASVLMIPDYYEDYKKTEDTVVSSTKNYYIYSDYYQTYIEIIMEGSYTDFSIDIYIKNDNGEYIKKTKEQLSSDGISFSEKYYCVSAKTGEFKQIEFYEPNNKFGIRIKANSFVDIYATTVGIPDAAIIEDNAFVNCNNVEYLILNFEDTATITSSSLYKTWFPGLNMISIAGEVEIEANAFKDYSTLQQLLIETPEGKLSKIGSNAFANTSVIVVNLSNTELDYTAFEDTSLLNVKLENVKVTGGQAFAGGKLVAATILGSFESAPDEFKDNPRLIAVRVEDAANNTLVNKYPYLKANFTETSLIKNVMEYDETDAYGTVDTTYKIAYLLVDGVSYAYEYYGSSNVEVLTITGNIIANTALAGGIAEGLFDGLTITAINIEKDVTVIMPNAFKNCETDVIMINSLCEINSSFAGSYAREILIYSEIEEIKENAFADSQYLVTVTLPKSLKKIGANAFANCYHLTEVYYTGSLDLSNESNNGGLSKYATVAHYSMYDSSSIILDGKAVWKIVNNNTIELIEWYGEEDVFVIDTNILEYTNFIINETAFYYTEDYSDGNHASKIIVPSGVNVTFQVEPNGLSIAEAILTNDSVDLANNPIIKAVCYEGAKEDCTKITDANASKREYVYLSGDASHKWQYVDESAANAIKTSNCTYIKVN